MRKSYLNNIENKRMTSKKVLYKIVEELIKSETKAEPR